MHLGLSRNDSMEIYLKQLLTSGLIANKHSFRVELMGKRILLRLCVESMVFMTEIQFSVGGRP